MVTMVILLAIEIFGFATYNFIMSIMGKIHPVAFIETFSLFWWQCIIIVILIITIIVRIPLHFKKIKPKTYGNFIALFFAISYIIENYYVYSTGYWNLQQSLPFHLCSISYFLCIVTLINYRQWLAECLYYWGLAGGIHALLTPEFTVGMEGYNFYAYFIDHGGLLLVIIYMIVHFKFVPRPKSWLWVLGYTQLVAIGVGIINYTVGANYMYLSAKPAVSNPFVIGEWPYYILVLEAVALVHFFVFYLPFAKKNKQAIKAPLSS
ncbi:MAG: TIGR02206 family membrane protein [Sediminibacterium sp.]|nr:MAG: TIGR02206 family membrane protein [Sediminibacterium sp.]